MEIINQYGGLSYRRARKPRGEYENLSGQTAHLFNLCCVTFGVGYWDAFRQVIGIPLKDNLLEWTAHLHLGTTDLNPFWGLKVWPP